MQSLLPDVQTSYCKTHIRFQEERVSYLLEVDTEEERAEEQDDGHEEDVIMIHVPAGTVPSHKGQQGARAGFH